MEGLVFKVGGKLEKIRWVYDEEKGEGAYVATDVTKEASLFLMEPVRFKGEIFLRDVFALLQANPMLQVIFARDWAGDYVRAASAQEAPPYTGEYSPYGLEYLELYQYWEKDSHTGEVTGTNRLDFHGVGFVLQDDVKDGDWVVHKKGSRISWAIELTPVHELLNLPLRYNPEVGVYEGAHGSGNYGNKVETLRCSEPTLGQAIHGILWELSFHGSPEGAQAAAEKLRATKVEVDEAIASGDLSKFVMLEPEAPESAAD